MKSWLASKSSFPRAGLWLAAFVLYAVAANCFGCLRPDGSSQADYIAYATNGPCNKYILYLITEFPGGIAHDDFVYKDQWNGIMTSHQAQLDAASNPTNYYIAIGTNWYSAKYLCGVANIKRYPGSGNGIYSVPDISIVTFSTPANLGIPDSVIAPPPAPGAPGVLGPVLVQAGNGYDGTPSMNPTNYALPGPMEQWNAEMASALPGNVSPTYFFATGFSPIPYCPMNGKLLGGDSGGPSFLASYVTNGITVITNWMLVGIHSAQLGNGGETGLSVDTMLAQSDTLNFITNNSFAPQTLAIQARGTNVVVTWIGSGILQSASGLSGTFVDVTNGVSPYTNSILNSSQQFFRLRPD